MEHRNPFFEDTIYFHATSHYPGKEGQGAEDAAYASRGLRQLGSFTADYFKCVVAQQSYDTRTELSYALRRHQFAAIDEFVECVLDNEQCMQLRSSHDANSRSTTSRLNTGNSDRSVQSDQSMSMSGDIPHSYPNPLGSAGVPLHAVAEFEVMNKLSLAELASKFVVKWKEFHGADFTDTPDSVHDRLYTEKHGLPGLSIGHTQADECWLQAVLNSAAAPMEPDGSGLISSATIHMTDRYCNQHQTNGIQKMTLDSDQIRQMMTLAALISNRWMDLTYADETSRANHQGDGGVSSTHQRHELKVYSTSLKCKLIEDVIASRSHLEFMLILLAVTCFLVSFVPLIVDLGDHLSGMNQQILQALGNVGMLLGFLVLVGMKRLTSGRFERALEHVNRYRSATLIPSVGPDGMEGRRGDEGRRNGGTGRTDGAFEGIVANFGSDLLLNDQRSALDYHTYAEQRPHLFEEMVTNTNGQLVLRMPGLPGATGLKLGVRALLKAVVFIGIDDKDTVFYWNSAAEELTGISPKEIYGKSIYTIVSENDRSALPTWLSHLRDNGKTPQKAILTLCTPQQGNVEVSVTAAGCRPSNPTVSWLFQPVMIMGTPPVPRASEEPLRNVFAFYHEQLRSLSPLATIEPWMKGMIPETRLQQLGLYLGRMQWGHLVETAKALSRPDHMAAEELVEKVMRRSMNLISSVIVSPELQRQYIQCEGGKIKRALQAVMHHCNKASRSVALSLQVKHPNTLEVQFKGIVFTGRDVQKTVDGVELEVNKSHGLFLWIPSTDTVIATFPIGVSREGPAKEQQQSFEFESGSNGGRETPYDTDFPQPGGAHQLALGGAPGGLVLVVEADALYRSELNRLLGKRHIVIEVNSESQLKAALQPGKWDEFQCAFLDYSAFGSMAAKRLAQVVSLTVVRTFKPGDSGWLASTTHSTLDPNQIVVSDLENPSGPKPVMVLAPWLTMAPQVKVKPISQKVYDLHRPFAASAVQNLLQKAVEVHDRFSKERQVQRQLNASRKPVYQIKEQIGTGQFGVVYRVVLENGGTLAMKTIRFSGDKSKIVREVNILIEQDHPNIVRFEHCENDENEVRIFMEYCPNGTLKDRIEETGTFPDPVAIAAYLKQLLKCLQHLHTKEILHLDIKPQNILFTKTGVLKVADFGTASVRSDSKKSRETVGTGKYISPELLLDGTKSPACDVWSVGVVALEMFKACPKVLSNNINETLLWVNKVKVEIEAKGIDLSSSDRSAKGQGAFRQQRPNPAMTSISNPLSAIGSPEDGSTEAAQHCHFKIDFGPLEMHLRDKNLDFVRYLGDARSFIQMCCAFESSKRPDASKLLLHPFITAPPVEAPSSTQHIQSDRLSMSSRGSVRDVVGYKKKSGAANFQGLDNDDIPEE